MKRSLVALPLLVAFFQFRVEHNTAQGQGKADRPKPLSVVEQDPEELFRKARKLIATLEGKHDLLKGVSKVKPSVQRDQKRLKSAILTFANNAVPPGKNDARAEDESKPFFYLSVQVWAGRSQSPPSNLHEFAWQGQTYQMWVRIFGSDVDLVKMVRRAVDQELRAPESAKASSADRWPGADSTLQLLAPSTASVLVVVAKGKAEIKSRSAAHLSTRMSVGKGETIAGGGYVFYAQLRQQFRVLEILHGKDKAGDRFLEYDIVQKTVGFPLLARQESIPPGARVIVLLDKAGNLLKALAETPESRKAIRAIWPEPKQK